MQTVSSKRVLGGLSMAIAMALLLATLALTPGTTRADDETVNMQGLSFSPQVVNISVGDTVTWMNTDVGVNHTSTSTNATDPWDSGIVTPGNSFARTFTVAGSFTYICSVHGTVMNGTVNVAQATTTVTTTTTTTPETPTVTTTQETPTVTATATTPATNTPTSTSTPTATATVPAATATSPATTTAVAPGPPDTGTGTVSGTNNALLLAAAGFVALGLAGASLVAIRRRA